MQGELTRLEHEQHRIAAEERLKDDAQAAERERYPETLEEKLKRGDAHLAAGRIGAALWEYASAYQMDPDSAAPRVRLGFVQLRRDPERARPIFESALEREPDHVSAHIGLGLSLLATGDRDAALRHLERAVELGPNSPRARAALGVSLDHVGRRAEALAQLEAARDLQPHDSRILNNLGVAYLRAGYPDRAEPVLRAALREDDRDTALRANNLGLALAQQGRFADALDAFRRGGDEQAARANLGYAHYVRGEYREAIAEYEQALLVGGGANVQVVRNLAAARNAQRPTLAPAPATPLARAPRGREPIGERAVAAGDIRPLAGGDTGDSWLGEAAADLPD